MQKQNVHRAQAAEILKVRYQAAWGEHSTRVTQRQGVIQIYVAGAALFYGAFFVKSDDILHKAIFLLIGVTALTVCCSGLIFLHNRVLERLAKFMSECEFVVSIPATEDTLPVPIYFATDTGAVHPFHIRHRILQRLILGGMLVLTNGLAVYLTWGDGPTLWLSLAASLCVMLELYLLFSGVPRDILQIMRVALHRKNWGNSGAGELAGMS